MEDQFFLEREKARVIAEVELARQSEEAEAAGDSTCLETRRTICSSVQIVNKFLTSVKTVADFGFAN